MTPLPVPNSDEVRVRLPMRTAPMPESVDHIHFGHEPAHEFVFEKLGPVLGKLKPGGWLSGTHYGLPGCRGFRRRLRRLSCCWGRRSFGIRRVGGRCAGLS